jgi:hypothetical protein
LIKEIHRARKEKYDVVLNFIFNRTTSGALLANIIAPHGLKVGQGVDKYQFYYNRFLKLDRSTAHMVETLYDICAKVFSNDFSNARYPFEIAVGEDVLQKLPELPDTRKERFVRDYGISGQNADILTTIKGLADLFEASSKMALNPKRVANWIISEVVGYMNRITVVKMARKMHKFQAVYTGYRVYDPKGFIKFNLRRTEELET